MVNDFRTFISAVTSEFETARDAVGADLRSRGQSVILQSDFRQGPDSDTLLGTLHDDHIRDCSALVCIIGKRSGASPPKAAAERTAKLVPGIAEASYTQWEFLFARHFKRRVYVYISSCGSTSTSRMMTTMGKSPAEIEAAVDALKQPLR